MEKSDIGSVTLSLNDSAHLQFFYLFFLHSGLAQLGAQLAHNRQTNLCWQKKNIEKRLYKHQNFAASCIQGTTFGTACIWLGRASLFL